MELTAKLVKLTRHNEVKLRELASWVWVMAVHSYGDGKPRLRCRNGKRVYRLEDHVPSEMIGDMDDYTIVPDSDRWELRIEVTNDGGPAFPTPNWPTEGGVPLRDFFAVHAPTDWMHGKAIQLRIADEKQRQDDESHKRITRKARDYVSFLCEAQYCYADAMLAEREKATNDV